MTTPSEGRPGWEQGSWGQSMDWLSNLSQEQQQNLQAFVGMTPQQRETAMNFVNLDDRQQANLMRAANSDPLRDRVNNAIQGAVARVHLAYDNTRERISDMATSLASQARDYRDVAVQGARDAGAAVAQGARDARDTVVQGARDARDTVVQGARDTRDTVVQGARNVADRATELGQQAVGAYETGRDRVVDAAQRGQVRLDQAWQAGADRVGEMRDTVVQGARDAGAAVAQGARDGRDAVVGAGRNAVAAGRDAVGRAGRWFEGKFNGTMLKAESVLNNYNSGRNNPDLQKDMKEVMPDKGRLEMIQQVSENLSARPVTAAENEAIQALAQQSQTRLETQTAMRAGLTGVAPAGGPAQPQGVTGQQSGDQGAQPKVNINKPKDNKVER
ncbi:hypothetical protein [Kribbella speibonae]|uniref:Uncharacterized protein n=1 Tax=Kribbella speibonae TaxID=1572660 RepID=A0A4R0JBQ8_9ACTN|nr:hypothetical protein [Kribbella speibonae]TCC18001.1 hypothetical protein E0H58_34810 [Kribbella speibonae]TCC42016.1 hypothetical protein E0H92_10400 [Kribbella speibonae]